MINKFSRNILIILLLLCSLQTFAQDYERAFGVKFGNNPGVFYRHFSDYKNSLESIVTFNRGGFQLTLLKETYQPVLLEYTDQFFVYYGFGVELGYTTISKEGYKFNGQSYKKIEHEAGIGICGVFGVEYHFIKYPMTISLDYLPVFQFYFPYSFYNNNINMAVSISYTF